MRPLSRTTTTVLLAGALLTACRTSQPPLREGLWIPVGDPETYEEVGVVLESELTAVSRDGIPAEVFRDGRVVGLYTRDGFEPLPDQPVD